MVINISAQYNCGLLTDIILLTQGYYHWGTRLNTMYQGGSGFVFIAYVIVYYYYHVCVMVYYIVSGVLLMFFWCPCMAINVSVQYNGGLLPDIILLTRCYFHRGTRLKKV